MITKSCVGLFVCLHFVTKGVFVDAKLQINEAFSQLSLYLCRRIKVILRINNKVKRYDKKTLDNPDDGNDTDSHGRPICRRAYF